MGEGELVLGPGATGATALGWAELAPLLSEGVEHRLGQELAEPVHVVGLRLLTASGDEIDLVGLTIVAGFERGGS